MGLLRRHYVEREKKDHVFHNSCLKHDIQFYDEERLHENESHVENDTIHTDNCPTQHERRQNFIQIAKFGEARGRNKRLIHKFASKHAFKGPWDATGKIVKSVVARDEFKFDRCSNAFDCCVKLKSRHE